MDDVYDGTEVDFTYNFDEACVMDEPEGWSVLQTLLQNILEVFSKLEVSIDKSFQEVSQKNSSEEKQDLSKAERLLHTLKSNWYTKCKEADSLRVSLKQTTVESERMNNEYNQMKDTILSMRKQFGDAVDSSVSDIEELSIVNSNLTERVAELEGKIEGAEKYFKKNVKGSLATLLHIVCKRKDDAQLSPPWMTPSLKREIEKLTRLVNIEDLFASALVDSSSPPIEKSSHVVDKATRGLNDSLKLELDESRKIIDKLRSDVRDLHREKRELLETRCLSREFIDTEIEHVLRLLQTASATGSDSDLKATSCECSRRSVKTLKKLTFNFSEHFNKLYEKCRSKSETITELHESTSYLNEQLKTAVQRAELLEDENHILKKKLEQMDANYHCCLDELDAMQSRLKKMEEERNWYIEENMQLKSGKFGIHGHYSNLDNENEKLLHKVKQLENEKDKVYTDLHEQMKKTSQYSSDYKEVEYKCEDLEHTIAKLKREYNNVTREMNSLSQENEELKKSVQDGERENILLKRNVKLMSTNNKDLEDQLFHLTRQHQKTKSDYEKVRSNIHEYSAVIKESEEKLAACENEKQSVQRDLRTARTERVDLEELNRELSSKLSVKEDIFAKSKIILTGYEKLLIKLLHQRKEIVSLLGLDKPKHHENGLDKSKHHENSTSLKIGSSQSMKYKLSSEIEENMRRNTCEVEASFVSISLSLQSSDEKWNCIERYYHELSDYINNIQQQEKDSCYYSTDGELAEAAERKSSAHAPTAGGGNTFRNLHELVSRVKVLAKHAHLADEKLIVMKRKSKKSIKIIRQLQLRLRRHKSVENSKRNRMLYLSKRLKLSRVHHHAHHKKHFPAGYHDDEVATSPAHRCGTIERSRDILNELSESLANTEGMIEEALRSVDDKTSRDENETSREETRDVLIDDIKKLKTCVSASRDLLLHKAPHTLNRRSSPTSEPESCKSALQEQRHYMMEHVRYTNKRLAVLLNCWQGNVEKKPEKPDCNNNCSNNVAGSLLKRMRDSFKSDEDVMRRAVDVLELTKAISMTELDEIQENYATDDQHLEVILLIKKMNENVESVLREARAQTSERNNNKSQSTCTLVGSSQEDIVDVGKALITRSDAGFSPPPPPASAARCGGFRSSATLKRESKLRMILENTQKRVGDLSEYLKQREADLKERDEIIAKLYKEYEELKQKANGGSDTKGSKSEQIILEYAKAKTRLEKENEFLQLVVREVREELLSLQKSCKKEEDTEAYLQNLVDELQMSNLSLEQSLDKMASELNIVKRDKEYLMQSLQLAGIARFYQEPCFGAPPYSPAAALRSNIERMYESPPFYADCIYCAQNSESSVLPFSDEEWVSAVSCDDCDSAVSDDEEHLDVVSSSESQTTTCSKLARNIKTAEATEKIKSKNRPLRYLQKETRTRKPFAASPKKSPAASPCDTSNASDTSSVANVSLASKDSRVVGRRESSMRSRSQCSSIRSGTSGFSIGTSISLTSQDSGASSPVSLRTSHSEICSVSELASQCDTWSELDVSPFLNPKFDARKRKKKFLQFGKK